MNMVHVVDVEPNVLVNRRCFMTMDVTGDVYGG
jgi:hypothetical protein